MLSIRFYQIKQFVFYTNPLALTENSQISFKIPFKKVIYIPHLRQLFGNDP